LRLKEEESKGQKYFTLTMKNDLSNEKRAAVGDLLMIKKILF